MGSAVKRAMPAGVAALVVGTPVTAAKLRRASGEPAIGGGGWGTGATDFRGRSGEHFLFTCPAGGTAGSVWGTGIYTDDSSVCTAAVHAGTITFAGGGLVTIEMRDGMAAYQGSTANGVTSQS